LQKYKLLAGGEPDDVSARYAGDKNQAQQHHHFSAVLLLG
jgi:hypothetical protein